jgi:hypothetical protein
VSKGFAPAGQDGDERRKALNAMKLRTLAAENLDLGELSVTGFPDGAAGRSSTAVAYLADGEHADRALGRALALAHRDDAAAVHVLADPAPAAVLARRAGQFARPPAVWEVHGRELQAAHPRPHGAAAGAPSPASLDAARMLAEAGAETIVEDGVLVGEVLGLEVARWLEDPPRLEVGVGRHDREAFALIHGNIPTADALGQVISSVRAHRRPGADHHPLNRLAQERWLRRALICRPAEAGCVELAPADPPVVRLGVKDPRPAVASGTSTSAGAVVVVTSVGIDPDLVPFAADARLRVDPAAQLVLVVPERDLHPVTVATARALVRPAEVITVGEGWRSWAGEEGA